MPRGARVRGSLEAVSAGPRTPSSADEVDVHAVRLGAAVAVGNAGGESDVGAGAAF